MQPMDTSHVLPLIVTTAAVATVIPERWFKSFFIVSTIAAPLTYLAVVIFHGLSRISAAEAILAFAFLSGMAVVFWSFPVLFGIAVGMAVRLAVAAVRDRMQS